MNRLAHHRARLARVFLGLVLSSLALVTPAFGDLWYKHYEQADKALGAGEWQEAVAQLNQAIERRGDSAAKARTYGMRTTAYFPYLKLGVALYELGKIDNSLLAFETEDRLGAIAKSEEHLAELERYRGLARQARNDAAEEGRRRIRQIVRQSLDEARALEGRGLLDEALRALGNGQSVAPDDPGVLAALEGLRKALVERQEERRQAEQAARWAGEGKAFLAAGDLGEAAAAFRKALALAADAEVEAQLEDAQDRLRAVLRRTDEAERAAMVSDGLREARELEAVGRLTAALDRLQPVLALEPGNQDALALEARVLDAQARQQRESTRRTEVEDLVAAARDHLRDERPEEALAIANRILALDSANSEALAVTSQAWGHISRDLLGQPARENQRPAIRFADLRQELEDGSRIEPVAAPRFQLSGLVIDDSPVTVAFFDAAGRELEGTSTFQPLGDLQLTNFSLRTRLPPGSSVFRVVATDSEGLSSASEYAVSYAPPFYRSQWFLTAVAAVALALPVAVLWQRARRRERLLRRRFNPYVAGAPILDEKLFFGREQLLDRILQTVHNNSLLLHGERRIGKTSLQHHLKRRLQQLEDPDYAFYPVFVDLQGTPEERFFATLADDVFQELEPVLGGLEPLKPPEEDGYDHRDLVRDLKRVLKALQRRSPKRVKLVLLIDEVDELNDYDPRINQKLRSLFMKSFAESLVSVVSGVAIKRQWEREGSPWYNFFEEIEVKAFQREDAVKLIERPIRGIFKLEDGLVDRVIAVTDCKPYLIQKLCVALVNRLHEENRRLITVADVDAVGRPEEA